MHRMSFLACILGCSCYLLFELKMNLYYTISYVPLLVMYLLVVLCMVGLAT